MLFAVVDGLLVIGQRAVALVVVASAHVQFNAFVKSTKKRRKCWTEHTALTDVLRQRKLV